MQVFALDFDGVLCDSAAECAVAAWRAGRCWWPAWRDPEPPAECLERFIRLRPLVETGYQTIPLMRLIARQLPDELIEDRFDELCDAILNEAGADRTHANRLFGQARDDWIARDPSDWVARNRFYPTVFATFAEHLASADPIFIVTTKEARFVKRLLDARGIRFPAERLFGFDPGRSKEAVLEALIQRPELRRATFHFVEDRLATLRRVAERDSLARVHLVLADWGYNLAAERAQARRSERITVWSQETFLAVGLL